jgi:hypothetical protein
MSTITRTLVCAFAVCLLAAGLAVAQGQYTSGTTGVDVSYPNCSATLPVTAFRIVGVSDGLGYSTNPCIATEAAGGGNLALYVNTGWNSASSHINATSPKVCVAGDNNCLAYNYGYNAGLYALAAANLAGVHAATWWLDVETANTWNTNVVQNQSSLQGEHDALLANAVTTVGVYSTTAQWQTITGSWINGWPGWGATTWTSAKQAQTYCTGHQFTGGPSYLMQYKARTSKLEQDVAC